jgi:hypothetical protein
MPDENKTLGIDWIRKLLKNRISIPIRGSKFNRSDMLRMIDIKNSDVSANLILDNIYIIDAIADALNEMAQKNYKPIIRVRKEYHAIVFVGEDQNGERVVLSTVETFNR